jgi:hypothetical protein
MFSVAPDSCSDHVASPVCPAAPASADLLEAHGFPRLGRNDGRCFHATDLLRDVAFTA